MIQAKSIPVLTFTCLLALTSCSQMQTHSDESIPAVPAAPAETGITSLQPISPQVSHAQAAVMPEPRFSIDVKDVNISTFLRGLVEGTPYSVVINPGVTGTISLDNLKDVSVPEVMAELADNYGYDISQKNNIFRVFPATLQTRSFQINYLNIKRTGSSKTRVTSGQITENFSSNSTGQSTGQTTNSISGVNASGSNISTESDSDFWKELLRSLGAIVKEGEGKTLVVSPEAGLVVVRALPAELRAVSNYLSEMHINMHQQVILETKILEVTLKDAFQAGINWGLIRNNLFLGQVGGQNAVTNGLSNFAGNGLTISPGTGTPIINGGNVIPSTAVGGAFVGAINLANFNAIVELLSTQGDVKVLSSPQVSTVNNQKAIIKVGTDQFFVTGVTNNTTTGTATTNSSQIQLTPFFSGIALDVTPRIYDNEQVILHVHPTVSEVTEQIKQIIVGGQNQSLPLAVSNLRESDSIVKARSGQVIVIGGLMQDRSTNQDLSTPFLSSIPWLGNLFKQQRNTSTKSELVILLRPIVVGGDQTWQDQLDASQARLKQLPPERAGDQSDQWLKHSK